VGSIFGVYHRVTPLGSPPTAADALQPGSALVCAGYAMFGSSTQLVLTMAPKAGPAGAAGSGSGASASTGVNIFTLDPASAWRAHFPRTLPPACAFFSLSSRHTDVPTPAIPLYSTPSLVPSHAQSASSC
jgi:hypothetical protein